MGAMAGEVGCAGTRLGGSWASPGINTATG